MRKPIHYDAIVNALPELFTANEFHNEIKRYLKENREVLLDQRTEESYELASNYRHMMNNMCEYVDYYKYINTPPPAPTPYDLLREHNTAVNKTLTTTCEELIKEAFTENGVTGLNEVRSYLHEVVYLADGGLMLDFRDVVTISDEVGLEELGTLHIKLVGNKVTPLW
jgi:hypothetical protein